MSETSAISCPIRQDVAHMQSLSLNMVLTLRKIRRKINKCPQCEAYDQCPLMAEFRSMVNTAIQEVVEEWNLAEVI